ncbi:hybrid sensor histidine kinase/response regulator [Hyalangium versicolor]|uniref:hybrid sensor histidine kinase/response regulator n=1 Tax=Hyalangium versicolor TaxID=2861190 RepID=UPI001CD00C14|nr:PAS domain-containing hybrid sensor histidine kinase/response regulator [Hyalangium versicolor]
MRPSVPSVAEHPLWLLVDAAGVVQACSPGSARLLGKNPRGHVLTDLFGEPMGRKLLAAQEGFIEWACPVSFGDSEPGPWRLERHRFSDGGLLICGGELKMSVADVPAAWERRLSRKHLSHQGDLAEQQRAFMLAIFDADPNLIFVKDRRGRFIFVNQACADLFSAPPDEVVLKHNAAIHADEDELEIFDKVDREVLVTQSEVRVEESFTRADGAVGWFDTRKRPLRAPDGADFVLGISVDITERKRMAELLHEANRRLELAVSAGQLGLWDWDVQAGTIYLSPVWKAQVGYQDSELENSLQTWESLMHPEDRPRALEVSRQYVSDPSNGDRYVNEIRMRAKDGSWRWIASYGLVGRDEQGQGVRVTGYHVDITARKAREAEQELLRENLRRTNEDLQRLARMKDEFLANMSHELRTPLNAVLGQAEAMSESIFGPVTEEQRVSLKTIEESGRHLLSLINDVLDITKSTVGRLELNLGAVPVEEVCQESLRLVREQARRKGITVTYASDGQVSYVWADRRRLRQVLLNLLANAQKFTPDGGRIGLEVTARPGGEVAFTVWDTGPGIARADWQRIFEPFVQLDAGLDRRHEGSGLGLALVRRMVELHQGRVELQSEVGKGSRFTVVLSVEEPSVAEAPITLPTSRTPAPIPSEVNACTVLIADDSEVNTRHLEDYLTAYGFRIIIARNGEEAVRMCRESKPSVVLMDIQMPRLNGLDAIRQLRSESETAHVSMVALTALAMPGDRERCLEAGADAYLSKPVRLSEVLEVVRALSSRTGVSVGL